MKKFLRLMMLVLMLLCMNLHQIQAKAAIAIDGDASDWDTLIDSDQTETDLQTSNVIVYYREENKLELYVKLSKEYQQQIPVDAYNLVVDGKKYGFVFRLRNEDGCVNNTNDNYELTPGIHWLDAFYQKDNSIAIGIAAITIDTNCEWLEAVIHLDELESLAGLESGKLENANLIQVTNPLLGNQNKRGMERYLGLVIAFATLGITGIVHGYRCILKQKNRHLTEELEKKKMGPKE